jgi:hypothetical protein
MDTPEDQARKLAPTYVNYFSVTTSPAIIRIAMGEAFGTPESAIYHMTVAMAPADAKALADLLLRLLTELQAQQPN